MRIDTQRFGTMQLTTDQLFLFPGGLVGMETLRQWALVADSENPAVAWLQSASRGDRAVAVVSPRVFFPDYRVHVRRRELAALQMRPGSQLYVLTTVSGHVGKLTTNLRAPLLLNLDRRIGCQVITDDDQPIRHPLPMKSGRSASAAEGIRKAA